MDKAEAAPIVICSSSAFSEHIKKQQVRVFPSHWCTQSAGICEKEQTAMHIGVWVEAYTVPIDSIQKMLILEGLCASTSFFYKRCIPSGTLRKVNLYIRFSTFRVNCADLALLPFLSQLPCLATSLSPSFSIQTQHLRFRSYSFSSSF